jgi:hypothetical protein
MREAAWASISTGTIPWVTSTFGISIISPRSGIGGGEALINSELEDSLDDKDEQVSTEGTESSIWQYATWPSSDYAIDGGHTIVLWGITSTLACFPFAIFNEAALGLFVPVLILRTPAFGAATAAVAFDTTVLEGAPALNRTLALGAASARGKDFVGAAFAIAVFMKLHLRLLMP